MYAIKSLLVLVALFLVLASALPTPRAQRRACRPNSPAPTPTPTADKKSPPPASKSTTASPSPAYGGDTPDPSPPASGSGGPAALFPLGQGTDFWTTSNQVAGSSPLSDALFRPTRDMAALPHPYVTGPGGKTAMHVHYPEGSYAFRSNPIGGVSFYAPGPSDVDLTTAKEVTFSYSVFFQAGFEFNRGGKLPGIYGGNSDAEAIGCSGGRRDDGCFSARLMWREDGKGEVYTYLPPSFAANRNVCNIKPQSECNPTYGASVGRGSFHWPAGQWMTVSERVRLNDVGASNGQIELFVNGESVINAQGLVLRNSADGRIRGIQMQSFFGGHSEPWASPQSQDSYFADFSIAITQKL